MDYSRYIRDGRLCWTLTSNGYKYLTWNFYKSWVAAHPQQPLLVLCADTAAYTFLKRESVPSVSMVPDRLPDFGPTIVPFGTNQFRSLNALKLRLLSQFAADERIRTCIYSDGDIVLYKPLLEDLEQRLQKHPLWFQCDESSPACRGEEACSHFCTGFIAFRRPINGRIFQVNDAALWAASDGQDQPYVNQRIKDYSVVARALPGDLYPNGARLDKRSQALMAHYNHRIGNQKIAAMKRNGDWSIAVI